MNETRKYGNCYALQLGATRRALDILHFNRCPCPVWSLSTYLLQSYSFFSADTLCDLDL